MHVIGLDAGGSKTVCVLADDAGEMLAIARGPGANLQATGEAGVERVLRSVIAQTLGDRDVAPAAICLGIAGVDRGDDARAATAILGRISPGARALVVNDALIALAAGVDDEPGIAVIAGTGSIVYGRNALNRASRAGGWGHILGDEGSAYWIGREALASVVRAADGRGPSTRLTADVLAYFRLDGVPGLVRIVYDRALPRRSVAALGPIVQRACHEGDAVALRILERAAGELAAAAEAVAARLEMRGDPFAFVLAGGVFRVVPWLVTELQRRLTEVAPRAQVRLLDREPASGAVHLALAEARGGARLPVYLEH